MLAAGDVYELAVSQSYQGSVLMSVTHYAVLPATLTSPQTKFQALADDFKEIFRPTQRAGVAYTGWKVTQVAGAGVTYDPSNCRRSGGDVYEGLLTGTLSGGTVAGSELPSFQAIAVALKTGFAGRSKRGQILPGGWSTNHEDSTDTNKVSATTVANLQTALNTFLTKYGTNSPSSADFGWSVFSRFIASGCKYVPAVPKPVLTHVQPANAAGCFFRVQTATPRVLWVPMRRRKEGSGV